jgi:hypothetical protein
MSHFLYMRRDARHAMDGRMGTSRADLAPAEENSMDKAVIELLARRAGLAKALADFPEDVTAAATQATNVAEKIKQPTDPAAEPWPPMRAGVGL